MPNTEPHTPSTPSPTASDPETTHNPHPFGNDRPNFVPAGFVFPDASKGAGAAQPPGAVQGSPTVDGFVGGFATMQHPESGGA